MVQLSGGDKKAAGAIFLSPPGRFVSDLLPISHQVRDRAVTMACKMIHESICRGTVVWRYRPLVPQGRVGDRLK